MGKESNVDPVIAMGKLTVKKHQLVDAQKLNRKKYKVVQEIYNMKRNLDCYIGYKVPSMTILDMARYINDCNHLQECLHWIYNEDYFTFIEFITYNMEIGERHTWKPPKHHPYRCADFNIIKEPFECILVNLNLEDEDIERDLTVVEGEIQDCKEECWQEIAKCQDELKRVDSPTIVRSPTIIFSEFSQQKNEALTQLRESLKESASMFLPRGKRKNSVG